MYENELTQAFCVPCFVPMVRWGDVQERTWECPECGPHALALQDASSCGCVLQGECGPHALALQDAAA